MVNTEKWWKPMNDEQRKLFESYRGDVRSALSTFKDGVCLGSIAGLLRECLGEEVPYRKIGFHTLSEFFFHMDDLFEVRMYNPYIYNSPKKFIFLKHSAVSESSSHVRDLVSHQVSGNKRRGEPKATYNNTIRVDSDMILSCPRPSASLSLPDQNRGPFQPRNHPYASHSGQTQRMPHMGYNRSNGKGQKNLLRPISSNQRKTPLLMASRPPPFRLLQENVYPKPSSPVSRSLLKNLTGIPPLRYAQQTVDVADSVAATPVSVGKINGISTSGGSTRPVGAPVPLLKVQVGALPRGPSLPMQHSDQVDGERLPRVLSVPEPETKNAFNMAPLKRALEARGNDGNTQLRKDNQGSVYRNLDHFFTDTTPSRQGYVYNGPRRYPASNADIVPRTDADTGPNSRAARIARVVENNLANDDYNDDDDPYEDYFSGSSSSEEFGVLLPGEKTLLTRSGAKEAQAAQQIQAQAVISAGHGNTDNGNEPAQQPPQESRHNTVGNSENQRAEVESSHNNNEIENQEPASNATYHLATDAGSRASTLTENGFSPYTLPPAGGNYMSPDQEIPFEMINVGKTKLRITQVNSSLDFMVVRADERRLRELDDLTNEMTGWYTFQNKKKSLPPVHHKMDKGLYVGFCEDTKKWRRVQVVLSDDDEEGYTTAFFIDYGVLKPVQLDKIHFLMKKYCELPRQAFFAEADFAKMDSPSYGYDLLTPLEDKLFNAVGENLVVDIQQILSSESIVPLLTVGFNDSLTIY